MWNLLGILAAILLATKADASNNNVWLIVGLVILAEIGWWQERRKYYYLKQGCNVGDKNFSEKYKHLDP